MVRQYVGAANFVKNLFKGGKPKTTGTEVISSVSTNVPKTTYQKKLRDLKIANQQLKASAAKLQQTTFESKQNMPFTFDPAKKNVQKKSKKKTKTKGFVGFKDFNKGGRVGKMGGGMMGRRFGMKKGSKFPDLTGDGKVTFADILKGRGVINGKKKKKKA